MRPTINARPLEVRSSTTTSSYTAGSSNGAIPRVVDGEERRKAFTQIEEPLDRRAIGGGGAGAGDQFDTLCRGAIEIASVRTRQRAASGLEEHVAARRHGTLGKVDERVAAW